MTEDAAMINSSDGGNDSVNVGAADGTQNRVQFNPPIEEWYDCTFKAAYLQGRKRGLSHEDAKDVAQDAAVKIWKQTKSGKRSVGFIQKDKEKDTKKKEWFPLNRRLVVKAMFSEHIRHAHMQGPVINLPRTIEQGWIVGYPPRAIDTLNALAHADQEECVDCPEEENDHPVTDKVKAFIANSCDETTQLLLKARLFEGKSFRKISDAHGLNPTAVRNRINEALSILRQELGVAV